MKKALVLVIFAGLLGLVLPVYGDSVTIENPLKYDTLAELIEAVINFLFQLAIVVAPLMVVVAGAFFILGGGSPEKVKTAGKILMYTAIGFGVILLSYGLIKLLKEVLGAGDEGSLIPLYFSGLGFNLKYFFKKAKVEFKSLKPEKLKK